MTLGLRLEGLVGIKVGEGREDVVSREKSVSRAEMLAALLV